MTPEQLLTHFYRVMPWLTDRFSQTVEIESAHTVPAGDYFNIEIILKEPNDDIQPGKYIHLSGGKLKNEIVEANNPMPQVWGVTTQNAHCQTTPNFPDDNRTILLNGVESALIEAKTRNTLTIANATQPTGFIYEPIKAEFGYCEILSVDGLKIIVQANRGYLYEAEIADLIVTTRLYVCIAKDTSAAQKLVADIPRDKRFALIIMGDEETVKKGRYAAVVDSTNQNNFFKLDIITQFMVTVVWPSAEIEAQASHMSEAYNSMKKAMHRLFYGAALAKLGDAKSIMPVMNGVATLSDNANYAHLYEYQALYEISMHEDGYREEFEKFQIPIRDFTFGGGIGADESGKPIPLPDNENRYFEIQCGNSTTPLPLTVNLDGN